MKLREFKELLNFYDDDMDIEFIGHLYLDEKARLRLKSVDLTVSQDDDNNRTFKKLKLIFKQ